VTLDTNLPWSIQNNGTVIEQGIHVIDLALVKNEGSLRNDVLLISNEFVT